MIFLVVLALATAGSAAVTSRWHRFSPREAARLGMAIALAFAGASHLFLATPFIQHLPTWVPLRAEIVLVSGLFELALGIALLLPPPTRRRVGVVLALYLVAVFPGNVYVAVFDVEVDGQPGGAYPWVRLPLQLLFIAWAIWCTREASRPVTVDPFRPCPRRTWQAPRPGEAIRHRDHEIARTTRYGCPHGAWAHDDSDHPAVPHG